MDKRYEYIQVGYLIIVVMVATMVLIGVILANSGINWIAIGVMVIIAAALVLFVSLIVVIREEELEVKFGPGLVKKRLSLTFLVTILFIKCSYLSYFGRTGQRTNSLGEAHHPPQG